MVSVGASGVVASSSSSGLGREEGVSVVVVVLREEDGAGAGLAREDVLPVEGRWGLKGLVFEAERSGGMVSDWDIEGVWWLIFCWRLGWKDVVCRVC